MFQKIFSQDLPRTWPMFLKGIYKYSKGAKILTVLLYLAYLSRYGSIYKVDLGLEKFAKVQGLTKFHLWIEMTFRRG